MFDEKTFLLLFFSAFVIAVIILVFLPPPEPESEEPEIPECIEKETRDCMRGPCEGVQTCINGEWSKCMVGVICTPGAKVPCVSNHCSSSYKICNECGTGYGECIVPE